MQEASIAYSSSVANKFNSNVRSLVFVSLNSNTTKAVHEYDEKHKTDYEQFQREYTEITDSNF